MADNRLILTCRVCGAEKVIAKLFAGHWSLRDYGTDAWLDEHHYGCSRVPDTLVFDVTLEHQHRPAS